MRRTSKSLVIAITVASVAGFALVGATAAFASAASPSAPAASSVVAGPPPAAIASPAAVHIAVTHPSYAEFPPAHPESAGASPTEAAPGCGSAPCPMGIVDYGLGPALGTYTDNPQLVESYWDSGTTFGIGEQTGEGGCLDGDAETGVCFTIQQNTVARHFNVAGSENGQYWLQNVPEVAYDASCSSPCVSGTYSVTWLDNIWNFSSASGICPSGLDNGAGCINPANFIGDQSGDCSATGGAPEFYYCIGPTVYDLNVPFTINAWTTVNSFDSGDCTSSATLNCIGMYGEITEGPSPIFGAYYDVIAVEAGIHGNGGPTITIADALTHFGLPMDFEWVFGGPGGGSTNAVETFGDMQSFWCISSCGSASNFHSIDHAWSSGADTAESISDVYVIPSFNPRNSAVLYFGADDPATSIW